MSSAALFRHHLKLPTRRLFLNSSPSSSTYFYSSPSSPFSSYIEKENIIVKSQINMPEITSGIVDNLSFPKFIMQNFLNFDLADKVAIIDGSSGEEMTFKGLFHRTYQTAHVLRKKFHIKKGACVGIMSPNHIDYFSAFHGIGLTGGFSTTINPLYTADELMHQLSVTGATVLIVHPMCMPVAKEVAKKQKLQLVTLAATSDDPSIITYNDLVNHTKFDNIDNIESFAGGKPYFPLKGNFNADDELVTVPFSSGTTGKPKGVMLTHKNLTCNVLQGMPYEGDALRPKVAGQIDTRGTLLCPLPFFHIYGLIAGLNIVMYAGAKLVFQPAFNLPQFLELIQKHKVTRAHIVPPIALALAKHPIVDKYDLKTIECLMSGAAPLGSAVQEQCATRLKCLVKQAWGMTELSPCGTITPNNVPSIDHIKGKSGLLVPNTEGKIVDPVTGKDLLFHQEGELLIRGPQRMKGYLNNVESTKNTIRPDGWLHTGDIGYFDNEGWLYITDRCKELIKFKGFQVPPAELEALILSMPAVKDVIVIPVLDDEAGEIPRAYVVKQDNCPTSFDENSIIDFVASKVAPHKKLRGGVKFALAVPKSASGKLLRRVQIQIDRGQLPPM